MLCPTFSFLLERLGLGHGEALHHLVALASLLVLRAGLVGRPDQHPAAEGVAVAPRRFLRPRNSVYWGGEGERRRRGGVTSHICAHILPSRGATGQSSDPYCGSEAGSVCTSPGCAHVAPESRGILNHHDPEARLHGVSLLNKPWHGSSGPHLLQKHREPEYAESDVGGCRLTTAGFPASPCFLQMNSPDEKEKALLNSAWRRSSAAAWDTQLWDGW